MKIHSIQIIPGVQFPDTAIIDVMFQPDENAQSFKHVRASYPEFVAAQSHYDAGTWLGAMMLDFHEWIGGLASRVSDAA